MFSLAVLIGRGLDHITIKLSLGLTQSQLTLLKLTFIQFSGCRHPNAPLAQLVEHLTLNQGVPGSSP